MRTRSLIFIVGLATAMGACALPGEEPVAEEESNFELKAGGCAVPKGNSNAGIATAAGNSNGVGSTATANSSNAYTGSTGASGLGGDEESSDGEVGDIADTSTVVDDPESPCANPEHICYEYETSHNNKPVLAGICAPPVRTVKATCAAANPCDCPDICDVMEFCSPLPYGAEVACFVPLPAKAKPYHGTDALAKFTPLPEEPGLCVNGNAPETAETVKKKKDDKKKADAKKKADDKKKASTSSKSTSSKTGKPAEEEATTEEETETAEGEGQGQEEEEEEVETSTGSSSSTTSAAKKPSGGASSGTGGSGGSSGSTTTASGTGGTTGTSSGAAKATGTGTATGSPGPEVAADFAGCFCSSKAGDNPATSPCAKCPASCLSKGGVCVVDAPGKAPRCVKKPGSTPATGAGSTATTSSTTTGSTPAAGSTAKTGGSTSTAAAPAAAGAGATPAAAVAYKDVKSIFTTKCARCHVAGGSGAGAHTFAENDMGAGLAAKNAKCAGQTKAQCAATLTASGDMPQGAGCDTDPSGAACVTKAEIEQLKKWAGSVKKAP